MPPIFQHILVPLDFTEKNQSALDLAREVAARDRGRITLLHVIEMIDPEGDDETEGFYTMLEAKARDKMHALAEPFETQGLPPIQEIVYGKRAAEIVRYTMTKDVTLIVMSSHKVDLADGARDWATLSHQVSILCQCPVLLVK